MDKYLSKESIAWISVSLAVIVSALITKSANCLWALFIPMIAFH